MEVDIGKGERKEGILLVNENKPFALIPPRENPCVSQYRGEGKRMASPNGKDLVVSFFLNGRRERYLFGAK